MKARRHHREPTLRQRLLALLIAALTLTAAAPALAYDWPGKLKHVAQGLDSASTRERVGAIRGLVLFPLPDALPLLRRALDDPSPEVRLAAIDALRVIGAHEEVDRLKALLNDPDPATRREVARALGALGDRSCLDALIRALGDGDVEVREAAVRAIGRLGYAEGFQAATARLSDPEARVVLAVIDVLADAGEGTAVFPILEKTRDPSLRVQVYAIEGLGRLGDPRAVRPLAGMLYHDQKEIRGAVIDTLGALGDPTAAPVLIKLLWEVHETELGPRVLAALGRLGDPRSAEALIRVLRHSPAAPAAADALKRIGPALIPEMLEILIDTDDRAAARRVLDVLSYIARPDAGATREQRRQVAAALVNELDFGRLPQRDLLLALAATRDPLAVEPLLTAITAPATTPPLGAEARELGLADRAPLIEELAAFRDARVVQPILDSFPGFSPAERVSALQLFGAARDPAALPVLRRALVEGEGKEPLSAARALGELGTREAGLVLLERLPTARGALRFEQGYALGRCADDEVRQRTWALAREADNPGLQATLLSALADHLRETPDPAIRAWLRERLRDAPDDPIAPRWADLLATHADAETVDTLMDVWDEASLPTRIKIAQILGDWREPRAQGLLLKATEARQAPLRAEAAWALGQLGDARAVPRLIELLDDHAWPVDLNAAAALARIAQPDTKPALQQRLPAARGPLQANLLLATARMGEPPPLGELRRWMRQRDATYTELTLLRVAALRDDAESRAFIDATLGRAEDPERREALNELVGRAAPASASTSTWTRYVFADDRGPMAGQRALITLPDGLMIGRTSDRLGELRIEHPGGGRCHIYTLDDAFAPVQ